MRISDWSSDVCSSDLGSVPAAQSTLGIASDAALQHLDEQSCAQPQMLTMRINDPDRFFRDGGRLERSEESRVGKECVSKSRSRWSSYYSNKKDQRNRNNRVQPHQTTTNQQQNT